VSHPITSTLSPSNLLLLPFVAYYTTPTSLSMAGEADRTLASADTRVVDKGRNASGAESDALVTSSSMTLAVIKMADHRVPEMSDYWKKSIITEADRQAYHDFGWLTGNLMSTVPEVDFPTTHSSTVVCFESHLIAGLSLPPSKFLVAIMNFLGCELVHFNPNVITTLSCFFMLCEYWLGISPDTSLF
jgi:hypothetical protein